MNINSTYPYPVLSEEHEDYIGSTFIARHDVRLVFGEFVVGTSFQLKDETLSRLIEDKICSFAIHVECSLTSFRKLYDTFNNSLEISIPSEKLSGKIYIRTFIYAKETIKNYINESLDEWFKQMPSTFEKGNILAIGRPEEFTLFNNNVELLDLPSIVNIVKSSTAKYMEVDINRDIIIISLPKYEYKQYSYNAKGLLKNTIMSTVIVPALVYVFTSINKMGPDLLEYTWYQVMENIFADNDKRLDDVGSDSFSALEAAQMVLRKPLERSFEEIEYFNELNNEERD